MINLRPQFEFKRLSLTPVARAKRRRCRGRSWVWFCRNWGNTRWSVAVPPIDWWWTTDAPVGGSSVHCQRYPLHCPWPANQRKRIKYEIKFHWHCNRGMQMCKKVPSNHENALQWKSLADIFSLLASTQIYIALHIATFRQMRLYQSQCIAFPIQFQTTTKFIAVRHYKAIGSAQWMSPFAIFFIRPVYHLQQFLPLAPKRTFIAVHSRKVHWQSDPCLSTPNYNLWVSMPNWTVSHTYGNTAHSSTLPVEWTRHRSPVRTVRPTIRTLMAHLLPVMRCRTWQCKSIVAWWSLPMRLQYVVCYIGYKSDWTWIP